LVEVWTEVVFVEVLLYGFLTIIHDIPLLI
jgi:hypothetical protein